MAFKARKVKHGFFEIHGIEDFVEKKFAELRRTLEAEAKKVAKTVKARATQVRKAAKSAATRAQKALTPSNPVEQLLVAAGRHPRGAALVKAGKQKDQLLRSLIPLYLARSLDVEVSSGATSRFWAKHGVKFAAPNAAKALREHVGYARRTKNGPQITPNGVKYVEAALAARKKAA